MIDSFERPKKTHPALIDHSHPQASHIGVDLAPSLVLLLEAGLRTIFQRDASCISASFSF
jgi:hypothetical protein